MAGDHVHELNYNLPDSIMSILQRAALQFEQEITRPSLLMKPQLVYDEKTSQWKAIYWSVCAVGDTPEEAFREFDIKWRSR